MSSFKRFPTSIRYLIARLRHWVQPTVWVPLAVLCAGGVFIWEVSVHPERLSIDDEEISASNNPAAMAGLSAEDSAIAAEIDSLPVLVNQFNRSNSDFALNSSVVKDKGLFDEIRDRAREISQPSSAPRQVVSKSFLSLPSLANPAVSAINNNPQNSSWQNSNATAALNPSGDGGIISGIKTIGPESGDTALASLPAAPGGGNSGQKNENPVPLSPLQAAMKKYIAANTSATVTSTQQSESEAKLPDRLTSTGPTTNQANLLPTTSTAQNSANPAVFSTGLAPIPAPTNTIINESQQFLNPAATAPESVPELNLRVPIVPAITTQQATPALPTNPYQTNLSGSAPGAPTAALSVVTPAPIPLVPNVGQSSFPRGIGGSKIVSPQFSPNSANSQFQPVQPSQPNLQNQPNFGYGVVPQNTNQGVQPIQPQSFSAPRQIPGRYIGGGEINTFSNP